MFRNVGKHLKYTDQQIADIMDAQDKGKYNPAEFDFTPKGAAPQAVATAGPAPEPRGPIGINEQPAATGTPAEATQARAQEKGTQQGFFRSFLQSVLRTTGETIQDGGPEARTTKEVLANKDTVRHQQEKERQEQHLLNKGLEHDEKLRAANEEKSQELAEVRMQDIGMRVAADAHDTATGAPRARRQDKA